ncbi:hypothetical protein [Armatimonas sp.]|uniref:hypothetical protein n=1 Tax=Armatimonas sp. TaxID=1872638 RepID=UPI00375268B0
MELLPVFFTFIVPSNCGQRDTPTVWVAVMALGEIVKVIGAGVGTGIGVGVGIAVGTISLVYVTSTVVPMTREMLFKPFVRRLKRLL